MFPIDSNRKSGDVTAKNIPIYPNLSNFLKLSTSDDFFEIHEEDNENIGCIYTLEHFELSISNENFIIESAHNQESDIEDQPNDCNDNANILINSPNNSINEIMIIMNGRVKFLLLKLSKIM